MRRRLALVLLLAAFAGPTAARAEDAPSSPPSGRHLDIVADRETHDFGDAAQHAQLETTFTLTNRSDHTVESLVAEADCGCNRVSLSRTTLEPGESTELAVGFRTGTLSGRLTKRIRVRSSNPQRGRLVIPVSISVVAGLIVTPGAVAFGDVAFGSKPTSHFDVVWHEGIGEPFELTAVEVPGHDIAASVEAYRPGADDAWRGHRVHLTFESPPPLGLVSAEVIVKTSHPEHAHVRVPLGANVVGKVWLQTRTIHFGVVPEGTARRASIRLRPRDDGVALGKVAVSCPSGHLKAEIAKDERREGTFVLTVVVPETASPGRLDEETIVVETQVPGEERIEIQVRGRVRARRD